MNPLIITYALNGLLMVAMPIGLAIFLTRRWKLGWGIWWIGFATFIISQLGHIPFNALVLPLTYRSGLMYLHPTVQLIIQAVFLGLSAGVFEEVSRYLVLRFWAKKARSWRNGVLFGAGHGGTEAIIIGIVALANYVFWIILRDPAAIDSFVSAGFFPANQVQVVQDGLAIIWSAPWYATLLGALERVFAMACHIFMATLVMKAFTSKKIGWLFAAIGFHALLDAVAVFCQSYVSVYVLEAIVGVFAVISVVLTFVLRQPEPQSEIEPVYATIEIPALKPVEETPENLDGSRYQN